jgi:hypothetical protein
MAFPKIEAVANYISKGCRFYHNIMIIIVEILFIFQFNRSFKHALSKVSSLLGVKIFFKIESLFIGFCFLINDESVNNFNLFNIKGNHTKSFGVVLPLISLSAFLLHSNK